MNVTIEKEIVFRDGEEVGTVNDAGEFVPADGLHHKTAASVAREVSSLLGHPSEPTEPTAPEPVAQSDRGDLDAEVVRWRKENWDKAQFEALYPPQRLTEAGLIELI